MFNVGDELKVCLFLLIANLIRALVHREAPAALLALRASQTSSALAVALRQVTSNPYLGLFLLVVLGQGVGWLGIIMTVGWAEVVRMQTGQP